MTFVRVTTDKRLVTTRHPRSLYNEACKTIARAHDWADETSSTEFSDPSTQAKAYADLAALQVIWKVGWQKWCGEELSAYLVPCGEDEILDIAKGIVPRSNRRGGPNATPQDFQTRGTKALSPTLLDFWDYDRDTEVRPWTELCFFRADIMVDERYAPG